VTITTKPIIITESSFTSDQFKGQGGQEENTKGNRDWVESCTLIRTSFSDMRFLEGPFLFGRSSTLPASTPKCCNGGNRGGWAGKVGFREERVGLKANMKL